MSRYAQAAAIVPEPCRVFGTMLRPFCLGHHLLFKRLGIALAGTPDAECSNDDIMIGVVICGQTYETTLEQFHTGEWAKVFAQWKKRVHGPFWRRRKVDINDSAILFRAYLADGYQKTPVWRHDTKNGISLSCPWELALKNRLVMAGYSESEVLNGYMPGRWYDYYTVSELLAAANCRDAKQWRKLFYTQEDFEQFHPQGSK